LTGQNGLQRCQIRLATHLIPAVEVWTVNIEVFGIDKRNNSVKSEISVKIMYWPIEIIGIDDEVETI
jgi:hypothetical protein